MITFITNRSGQVRIVTTNVYLRKMKQVIKLSVTTPTTRFLSYSNNAVSLNDRVYFIGTDDGEWTSGIVYIFNTITEAWIDNGDNDKPPHPAIYGCLTANTTHLFFIGGKIYGDESIDRLQIYDINSNQWFDEQIDIAPIKNNGWNDGYCQFVNEYLYIFGGYVGDNVINHILKWNPSEKWNNIGYLPSTQADGIAVRNGHIIYIIGDYRVITIYEFDTNIDQITNEYNMVQALEHCTSGILNNKLYVFGGWNSDIIDDVQICDIIENLLPTTSHTDESASSTTTTTTNPTTSNIAITTENTAGSIYRHNDSQSTIRTTIHTLKTTEELKNKDDREIDDGASILIPVLAMLIIVAVLVLIVFIVMVIYICYYGKGQLNHEKKVLKYGQKEDNKQQQNIVGEGNITDGMKVTPMILKRKVHKDALDVQYWCVNMIELPQYFVNFMDSGYEGMDFIKEISNWRELHEISIVDKKHQQKIMEEIKKLKGETLH